MQSAIIGRFWFLAYSPDTLKVNVKILICNSCEKTSQAIILFKELNNEHLSQFGICC